MTAVGLPNNETFKQYLLTLLREDTSFKYTLIDVLFKDAPFNVMKARKDWTTHQKINFAKKHAIKPETLKDLQDLFKMNHLRKTSFKHYTSKTIL